MAGLILVDLADFVIANRAQLFIWCGRLAIDIRHNIVPSWDILRCEHDSDGEVKIPQLIQSCFTNLLQW